MLSSVSGLTLAGPTLPRDAVDRPYEQERREFVRVHLEIPVTYRFVSQHRDDSELDHTYRGTTSNISAGGLLLRGEIPLIPWIPELLMQKMLIGVTLGIPDEGQPIKALARVAWLEAVEDPTLRSRMGLAFREITAADRERIFQFVLKSLMPM